jgi:hypothetical protein
MNAVEHGPDAMAVYAVDTADAWAVRQLDCGWIRSDLGELSDAGTSRPPGRHLDRRLPAAVAPHAYAEVVTGWQEESGIAVAAGWCGSTSAHLQALRSSVHSGHRGECRA